MLELALFLVTVPLVIIHFVILYDWVFDWEQLVTQAGLISWIGSMVVGVLLYFAYRKMAGEKKSAEVFRKILLSSTIMVITLGVLALGIMAITSAMP